MVVDGGTVYLTEAIIFYFMLQDPDKWLKDSLNKRFTHQKIFILTQPSTLLQSGGAGKRIASLQVNTPSTLTVNSFNERIFHELDTINLLSSGKEWLG
jgi:hypothetical protein